MTKKLVDLLHHIRLLNFGTPGFTTLKCNLDICQRSFMKFTVFRNHVYQFHANGQLQSVQATDMLTPSDHGENPPNIYPEIEGLETHSRQLQ